MTSICADARLSNLGRPELEELTANVLIDTGALDMVIPEHIAVQLQLTDLKPREVTLADGSRQMVRYVGPLKVDIMGRDCVTAAAVMGNQVLLGAIPMEAMDMVIHPRTQQIMPNPESPDIPKFWAISWVTASSMNALIAPRD